MFIGVIPPKVVTAKPPVVATPTKVSPITAAATRTAQVQVGVTRGASGISQILAKALQAARTTAAVSSPSPKVSTHIESNEPPEQISTTITPISTKTSQPMQIEQLYQPQEQLQYQPVYQQSAPAPAPAYQQAYTSLSPPTPPPQTYDLLPDEYSEEDIQPNSDEEMDYTEEDYYDEEFPDKEFTDKYEDFSGLGQLPTKTLSSLLLVGAGIILYVLVKKKRR